MERVPEISKKISWCTKDNLVIITMKNRGIMNFLMQKIFHKPRVSVIHLDEIGSFIWQQIDGKNTTHQIADKLKNNFGENINPLYERLFKYFEILSDYKFIIFKTVIFH